MRCLLAGIGPEHRDQLFPDDGDGYSPRRDRRARLLPWPSRWPAHDYPKRDVVRTKKVQIEHVRISTSIVGRVLGNVCEDVVRKIGAIHIVNRPTEFAKVVL